MCAELEDWGPFVLLLRGIEVPRPGMLLREKQVPYKPFRVSHSAAISEDGVVSEKKTMKLV